MAMGVVNDDEFNNEKSKLVRPTPIINPIITPISRGRGEGNLEVPDSLRKVIGEESIINGRDSAVALANTFGISPSSVSAYSNGSHSTATYDKSTDIKGHINGAKERVIQRAHKKMKAALTHITEEKLALSSARDLSGVAKDMAAIIKNMEPEQQTPDEKNRPQFIFYAPQIRDERSFETIYVKE